MASVRWTAQAAADLESITEFIASDSPHFARLFALDIRKIADRIGLFPGAGRMVPECHDESIREFIFGNYRIVYKVMAATATIMALHHGSRLLDPSHLHEP